jgi:1,4-alpha-glucan branching enzyme
VSFPGSGTVTPGRLSGGIDATGSTDMAELLSETDVYLFNEGTHNRIYEHLGAHIVDGGTHFAVWAPNAGTVSVIGDFNAWDPDAHPLFPTASGIWKGYVEGSHQGNTYKYRIVPRDADWALEKADPYAFHSEVAPKTASVVWPLDYEWGDDEWMANRARSNAHDAPMSIYEVHIGSWKKKSRAESFSYRELAPLLAEYCTDMGYTHVEFLPIAEHPYFPSWGYQTTGYFAPTSRFGTPQDLMYLIDQLHQAGIGLLLDWVPSHFATDAHGLERFDGSHLYEHADPRKGWHPDWNSNIFNYGRNEVRSFLLSNAMFWLDRYHVDGLRVDAVASMLYLDYSREEGQWIPNQYGGNENLEAISLLRQMNRDAYGTFPGIQTIAEESTAFPGVSRPTDAGGLGFGFKWDMGWMHDTLEYFRKEPVHRAYHQGTITFRMLYAFDENFILSLSHDEVVHGKGSLVNKMPGDQWQQFANLRALYGYMYGMPGKKLLFMGCEFGQRAEWNANVDLDWYALDYPHHAGMQAWVRDLNTTLAGHTPLHEVDFEPAGFEWIDASDAAASVLSFLRKDRSGGEILVVGNFTPVLREGYRVGASRPGGWEVLLNSDAADYWGSGTGSTGTVHTDDVPMHGRNQSLSLDLPPLGVLFLRAP